MRHGLRVKSNTQEANHKDGQFSTGQTLTVEYPTGVH